MRSSSDDKTDERDASAATRSVGDTAIPEAAMDKSTESDTREVLNPSSSLLIQDPNVEQVKIGNKNNIKLALYGTCLYMKPITMLFLFDLEQCVEHVFYELSQYTHGVSEKFKYFASFLRENCITNKRDDANILYRIHVKNSAIVCELTVYGLDYIVHVALHEKINIH
ncbi:hypothetical protein ALC57_09443 [Trachymyrmex cornetzi]|uniref:Uncharacterized protein n=1 Tax=Trachymyrmex cornetzi TaxID=471704 RepID=A0A151J5F4_9HYME|nr:hypothetical protein ALC57_09443 [Trachymyrmex cornetzi]